MRDVPQHIDDAFYSGNRSDEVPFVINDSVEINAGPFAGRRGAVISVEAMQPLMTLRVELGDNGEDVVVLANDLRRVGT